MGIEDELGQLDKTWKETEKGAIVLPDGNFVFRIDTAVVNKSQGGPGRLQVALGLRVVAGEHIGKELKNYQGLDNHQSIGFFRNYMSRMELALPASMQELPAWVATNLPGKFFLGQVKNKNGFTNVYITKRATMDPTAVNAALAAAKAGLPPAGGPAATGPKLGM